MGSYFVQKIQGGFVDKRIPVKFPKIAIKSSRGEPQIV